MLSELETLELLEQLKLGVLPGAAGCSEVDTVGHWPVLIGGGMCLNLQTVAALELNSQPEYIDVTPSAAESISCADLAARYQLVHHLSTGVDGRTIVIAYDSDFSPMLSLLQKTDYHSGKEYFRVADIASSEAKNDAVARQYEFSQAIATSVDPGPAINGQPVGLSFLALDAVELPLAGAWQLQLRHGDLASGFFIGLINSHADPLLSETTLASESFSISVRVERICRRNGLGSMVAELAQPERIKIEKIEDRGHFPVADAVRESMSRGNGAGEPRQRSTGGLAVQRMLQLSVDDLYLLLVEAAGKATELTFSFELEPLTAMVPGQLLREGCRHRCLAVNGLPVREAYLIVSDGKCQLKSQE